MRIAYFGTPTDAVAPLRCASWRPGTTSSSWSPNPIADAAAVVPPTPSPVKAAAAELGLAVRTPDRAREVVDELAALDLDAGVVVAFGQLLPPAVLATARHGFVNLHFSLLPRWRGAAPVERAMLAGDAETGVCVMAVDEGMDTGGVFAQRRHPDRARRHRRGAGGAAGRPRHAAPRRGARRSARPRTGAPDRGAHPRGEADGRRVPPRLGPSCARARPAGDGRQPAPRRVDHRSTAGA